MPRRPSPQTAAKKVHTGELALIQRIRQRASSGRNGKTLRLGIGDDCAILSPPPGSEILVTTDFSLEGRHFRREWHSPDSVGHRTLARGLSDLAAMGAKPMAAFLSLALPREVARDGTWLDGFLDGLLGLAKECKVPLAGGDLSESPSDHILADIVLLGSTPAGSALRRSGARAGDLLYCTGTLGGAAAELASLPRPKRSIESDTQEHPHLFPKPRLRVGSLLRERKIATACIDLSDGLSTDFAHICDASGLHGEIDARALPLHELVSSFSRGEAMKAALHGGEDYELLFTARGDTRVPTKIAGVPITRIGRMLPRKNGKAQVTLLDDEGRSIPLEAAGWEHLR